MPTRLSRSPQEIDKALSLVRGHVGAAAKLLDLTPKQLSNVVNYRPALKAKWGKRIGRPKEQIGFTIAPVTTSAALPVSEIISLMRILRENR